MSTTGRVSAAAEGRDGAKAGTRGAARSMPSGNARASAPLAGLRAVITGGAGGIGFAIAERLDAMGAATALIGRDGAKLDAAVRRLGSGRRHEAIVCDVGDSEAVNAVFRRLDDDDRTPHILVNNAGRAHSASLAALSDDAWDEALRVNLTGTFLCTRAAMPAMLALPIGRVVNIASTAGLIGYPHVAAYCAAKHGVVGLTRALALEFARSSVTVNAICPGYTETAIVTDAIASIARGTGRTEAEAREAVLKRNPQRRLVEPAEVAAAVAWLCMPESQSINGQAISVSGGEVMTG